MFDKFVGGKYSLALIPKTQNSAAVCMLARCSRPSLTLCRTHIYIYSLFLFSSLSLTHLSLYSIFSFLSLSHTHTRVVHSPLRIRFPVLSLSRYFNGSPSFCVSFVTTFQLLLLLSLCAAGVLILLCHPMAFTLKHTHSLLRINE